MGSPDCLQIPGASALGAPDLRSAVTWECRLFRRDSLISSLLVSRGMLATAHLRAATKALQWSREPTYWTGLQQTLPAYCRASCHGAACGFRQTPLTWSILVLVPYVFLVSDNAICHESLTIRIVSLLAMPQNNRIHQTMGLLFPYWFTRL